MAKSRIGFLGLGAMGGAMARRLVQSGFTVVGYDVSQARAGTTLVDLSTIAKRIALTCCGGSRLPASQLSLVCRG